MRTIQSYKNEIARLRERHTRLFKLNKFREMQTVNRKIRECWAAWHQLKERSPNAVKV